jgi:hypothetical protein
LATEKKSKNLRTANPAKSRSALKFRSRFLPD